ncbi:hypothetical protein AVEN_231910-1, partial [Araneus ventricosus]
MGVVLPDLSPSDYDLNPKKGPLRVWAMPKSSSMGHVNKAYVLTLQKTPSFKKKTEGEGRGQWSVDAMKFACS